MRLTPRTPIAIAACAALVAIPAATAQAQPGAGEATSFTASFSTARPDAASGLSLRTTGRPPVPPTTLAPVIRQTVTLPRGTRLRLGALPQCTADDAALAAQGAEAACPPASRVGTGRAEGVLGGAPVVFDLGAYAIRGRLFFAGERFGQPLRQGFWGTATGRRLALVVPTAAGAVAPTLFRARIPARPGGAVWLRTPARCPAGGNWRFAAAFAPLASVDQMAPIGPVQRLDAASACRR
jgi:hypothetical protein